MPRFWAKYWAAASGESSRWLLGVGRWPWKQAARRTANGQQRTANRERTPSGTDALRLSFPHAIGERLLRLRPSAGEPRRRPRRTVQRLRLRGRRTSHGLPGRRDPLHSRDDDHAGEIGGGESGEGGVVARCEVPVARRATGNGQLATHFYGFTNTFGSTLGLISTVPVFALPAS